MILVLAQTKGGVGKSTIAVNLAVERARAGRDVLLVDADEQATATDFTALRTEKLGSPGYTAVALSGAVVRTQVLQMRGKFGDIIIDAGGRDTAGLRAALTIADVALVPFQPRSFDLWTLEKVASLLSEAQPYRQEPLRALAILNFADPQGGDNASAAEALTGNEVLSYLDAPIGRRKAFPNAAAEGRGVSELRPQDPKASAEIATLTAFLFDGTWAISDRYSMVIAPKPKRAASDGASPSDPMAFIQGAEHQQTGLATHTEGQAGRARRKEPVIIRFDKETLKRVDKAAAKRGLSRAALVRMLVIEHLPD